MTDEKRMTALNTSVGADDGRSLFKTAIDSITDEEEEIKSFEQMEQRLKQRSDPSFLDTVTMSELFDCVFENKPPIVDGLLSRGMYLFAGAPKLGKSFLVMQLAYHVSTGRPLWGFPVRRGTVLYLALEDGFSRLQKRLYRMYEMPENDNLFFSISAKKLGGGLHEQLSRFCREHPDTALIIIDTLQKVRELGGDSYSYASDYDIITQLKTFADSSGICLIVVHHTRKQRADDAFDMISGTNGLIGAADGAFLLHKEKRTSNEATLEICGRDQQDQRLYLIRDEERLCWELDRVETELWKAPPEPILAEITKRITADSPVWSGSPTELCEFLGVDMKPNALTQKLNVNAGRLLREHGIMYWNRRCHTGRQIGLRLEGRDDA